MIIVFLFWWKLFFWFLNNGSFLYMLHYDRFYLSEGIDVAIINNSEECIDCGDWFFNHEFKFQNCL